MKIALAQINAVIGDNRGNASRIQGFAERAAALGADLAVFPEQSLSGYPALDLWEEPAFVKAGEAALSELAKQTGDMALLVGFVAANRKKSGKPIQNAAALLHRGKVKAVRAKTLLPTYDVFDEARYFEPASENAPILFKGKRLGVTICEDAWAREAAGRRLYSRDPVEAQRRAGADLFINLSASPFERGKSGRRLRLLSAHARKARKPFLYCNLVGGNDELIFDGSSLALDGRGQVIARGLAFDEDLILVDTKASGALPASPGLEDVEEVRQALVLGLKDYLRKCGFAKAVVGLSGGIDSAVVCALAAQALGPENVTGVAMPSRYSSADSFSDAEALAKNLGTRFLTLPIEASFKSYLETLKAHLPEREVPGLAEQNLQARVRGNLLMALSNQERAMVLTTGNKSELAVGYCTLYGDMAGGLAPIADLAKTEVYELARWINREREVIPRSSLEKAPSAELKPGQKDQDDLPPYETLDAILKAYVEKRLSAEQIVRQGFPAELVGDILRRIDAAEFKRRQAAPSLKVSPKAYGVGRRVPIAKSDYRAAA